MTEFKTKVGYQGYDTLCAEVQACHKCPRMQNSARVLSRAAGPINASVMFIGEAPGRLGADSSQIPFHGDKAGANFEDLLGLAGLTRRDIFVTNSVLCNPKSERGNNSAPVLTEIANCSSYLRQQIDLVNPRVVVTLGGVALRAIRLVEEHSLVLADAARSAVKWYGRTLVPLYHPGQRAMIQRPFADQIEDYRFVGAQIGMSANSKDSRRRAVGQIDVGTVAREIVESIPGISYFALHKLFYLLELDQVRRHGRQLTNAFFVRQKDGPYCVDLHPHKLRKALLAVVGPSVPRVVLAIQDDLFGNDEVEIRIQLPTKAEIRECLAKYRGLDNGKLKTKAYLSRPMKQILKEEKKSNMNLYNMPIDLSL